MKTTEFRKIWHSIKRKVKTINLECNGHRMNRIFADSYVIRVNYDTIFIDFYMNKILISTVLFEDVSMISEGVIIKRIDKNE